MADTPELDKMLAVKGEAETISRFVDWLAADGIVLARYGELYDVRLPCPECCLGTEGHLRASPRAKVKGCAGLDHSRLSTRERQVLSTLEGVSTYKSVLLEQAPCPRCRGECFIYEQRVRDDVLHEVHESYEGLFARFFEIDADAAERERMQLLKNVRANQA